MRCRLNSRNKYGTSVMERLARDTGGVDFDARKTDMASEFKSIGEQLRSSYIGRQANTTLGKRNLISDTTLGCGVRLQKESRGPSRGRGKQVAHFSWELGFLRRRRTA